MNEVAIRARNLGKRYRIGERERYRMLREAIAKSFRTAIHGRSLRHSGQQQYIWALKEVAFEVAHGEVVGFIGPNGAGKSTLLKVLSRITEPTTGSAEITGKIGSLLEVGTGFHQELTGRENIYLSGAILGMKKREIDSRFDNIVSFAEVEKFIDTPLKRYSSGMQVRLGFAVAAFLEPDILLVDEVLAVGDAAFQKKCLGKLGQVTREGRTILFVSHNLRAITDLCQRCLWIKDGEIVGQGEPQRVVLDYLTSIQPKRTGGGITSEMHADSTGDVYFRRAALLNEHNEPVTSIFFGDRLRFNLEMEVCRPVEEMRLTIAIERLRDGALVAAVHNTDDPSTHLMNALPGRYSIAVDFDLRLMPSGYTVHLAAKQAPGYWGHGKNWDLVQRALDFHVEEFSSNGRGVSPSGGILLPTPRWEISQLVQA
jgi:lipopolysaccharide transport system ATP-binding protein